VDVGRYSDALDEPLIIADPVVDCGQEAAATCSPDAKAIGKVVRERGDDKPSGRRGDR